MRRVFFVAMFVVAIVGLTAAPVWAHVSVNPSSAPKGGFTTLTFQVPNEREDAKTVKVEVQFPQDHPIADASVMPVPGWTVKVAKKPLTTPITTDEGATLNDAVGTVTWTASNGGLGDGEFQQFPVSVALPSDTDSLVFPTIQTYSDGKTVDWVERSTPGAAEPENPAPTLALTAGTTSANDSAAAATTTSDDSDSNALAIVGLVVGALGLIVAIVALVAARRRAPTAS